MVNIRIRAPDEADLAGEPQTIRGASLRARLVGPDAARVIDELVRAFVERDRFEHVVIDQHDHHAAFQIAVSISISVAPVPSNSLGSSAA